MKYLIVGGVAGGATVAARLRRIDEKAQIILFERGEYVSYANCGLPYHIGGTIAERDNLFVQTVEGFVNRFRIDIRNFQEVTKVIPEDKSVEIKNLKTGEIYTEKYDKLVLSPGAEPLRPRIEGIDYPKIFTLRNVPDTDTIKGFIEQQKPKHAVVVGGGFIGLEMAENLHEAGVHVSVIEMADQVMGPLDFSLASVVHHHLTSKGVELLLGDGVKRFEELSDKSLSIHLNSGKTVHTDMVILSIGIRPENKLAREAGLALGERGGIKVNEYLQTSDPDIYALGDAAEIRHLVTKKPVMIPLAGPANKQGRIVANNIVFGNTDIYKGAMGTSIAKIFDLTVAVAGANAKLLMREGIPYISSFTHGSSHAGYYPGALPLTIKIIFSPDKGTLLGAQVVGFDGVDKRIEMLAQVIQHEGTIYDLMELEHAYAPPYASAKDPVNIAGFAAENILKGRVKIITWREIADLGDAVFKIDVRTPDEFGLGSIPGFVNIPLDSMREHLDEIPKDQPIVVTCAVGLRGYLAYRILVQNGFKNVRSLSGGYKTWKEATTPICNGPLCSAPTEIKEISDDGRPVKQEVVKQDPKLVVDACGLMCPGPIMKLKKNYADLQDGDIMTIKATDQAFGKDVASWCKMTGAQLLNLENKQGVVAATVQKAAPACKIAAGRDNDNKTMVVFSDDLDKALASFVIANGAASTGKKVTMFFTFWGLNIIKKREKPSVQKDFMGKMFSCMLPSSSKKLKLSKMNMAGMGSKMMRNIMEQKRIDSLESLMQQAIENGVEMIACTMSMDVMGVKKEELLDNVTLGGVATYLERTEEANLNLFI